MKKIATLAVSFALIAGAFATIGCDAKPSTTAKPTTPSTAK